MPFPIKKPFTRPRNAAAAAAALLLVPGCGDDEMGPENNAEITVRSITTGTDLDPDGYTVTVGGTMTQTLGVNAVTVFSVTPGDYTVELSGVAGNCTVTASNPVTITARAGDPIVVPFTVDCGGFSNEPILFVSDVDGDSDIYRVDPDGSNLTPITANGFGDDDPSWSPDRSEILFVSDRDGNWEIYRADADGTNATRLTFTLQGTEVDPVFSADGTKIAYTSDAASPGQWDVYVMDADGSNVRAIAPSPQFDANPDFSPDGSQVVFQSKRTGNTQLYIASSSGAGAAVPLLSGSADDADPEWASDGSVILFASDRSGDFDIWSVRPDGSGARNLTSSPGDDGEPTFAPDLARICWATDRDGDYELYVMDSAGGNPTRVTMSVGADEEPDWGF